MKAVQVWEGDGIEHKRATIQGAATEFEIKSASDIIILISQSLFDKTTRQSITNGLPKFFFEEDDKNIIISKILNICFLEESLAFEVFIDRINDVCQTKNINYHARANLEAVKVILANTRAGRFS